MILCMFEFFFAEWEGKFPPYPFPRGCATGSKLPHLPKLPRSMVGGDFVDLTPLGVLRKERYLRTSNSEI